MEKSLAFYLCSIVNGKRAETTSSQSCFHLTFLFYLADVFVLEWSDSHPQPHLGLKTDVAFVLL